MTSQSTKDADPGPDIDATVPFEDAGRFIVSAMGAPSAKEAGRVGHGFSLAIDDDQWKAV